MVKVVPLAPQALEDLAWAPCSYFTVGSLCDHLARFSDLGWRAEGRGDYAVGGYWKQRSEVGLILETTPSPFRPRLVARLLEAYRGNQARLVLLSDREEQRALEFYLGAGFGSVETVVIYEKPNVWVPPRPRRLDIREFRPDDGPQLAALEQATFPWLWWYDAREYRSLWEASDRSIYLAFRDRSLVGYAITTVRDHLGHLDRLGIHPSYQGLGYGADLLAFAIQRMASQGAWSVGLSTQAENGRSQRLYEGFGFRRTGDSYQLYGLWLDHPGQQVRMQSSQGGGD